MISGALTLAFVCSRIVHRDPPQILSGHRTGAYQPRGRLDTGDFSVGADGVERFS